jgi:hypothetical protein
MEIRIYKVNGDYCVCSDLAAALRDFIKDPSYVEIVLSDLDAGVILYKTKWKAHVISHYNSA